MSHATFLQTTVTGAFLALVATATATPPPAHAGRSPVDLSIEEHLRDGEVISEEALGAGVTRSQRLTIRHGGLVRRAVFKTVNLEADQPAHGLRWELRFRDSYRFEVAAYRLDRLLGLGMVPVTVVREVGGRTGAVQDWVEGSMTLDEAIRQGVNPRRPELVPGQFMSMYILDALVDNVDRNIGNILVRPERDEVFLIDHSRSFRCRCKLPTTGVYRRDVPLAPDLAEHLRSLDRGQLERALGDLLTREQVAALLRRQELLLAQLGAQGLLPETGAGVASRGPADMVAQPPAALVGRSTATSR